MKYRRFRQVSTGKWTDALLTSADGSFGGTPASAQAPDIAAALSLPAADIGAVEGPTDPIGAGTVTLPLPPPPPPPLTRNQKVAQALAVVQSDPALAAGTKTALGQIIAALRT